MDVPTRGDISVQIHWRDLAVALNAENASWAPDIAADMIARMKTLWADTLAEAYEYGLLTAPLDFAETTDEETDGGTNG